MKGLSQTEYNILGDIEMFEVESDTNTYNSLYTDVIQRINDIVTDKVHDKPKTVNGWSLGRWIEKVGYELIDEGYYDVDQLNISLYHEILGVLGNSTTSSIYNPRIGKYYVFDINSSKWNFVTSETRDKLGRKERVNNLVAKELELHNVKFTDWNLERWVNHIAVQIDEEPSYLSETIKEYLRVEFKGARLISSIDQYYVYKKEVEQWHFLEVDKYFEIYQAFT